MENHSLETPRTLLAYYSHSYRPSEKEINLFFWELLSKHNLYFTVDAEQGSKQPMDISYLEWMMQRSACFVAVIPRRENAPPYNCSPYQVFENSLAIRAKKPRLIFVEEGLDETIFVVQPYEVCSFRRRWEWLEEDTGKFIEYANRLAQQTHAITMPNMGLIKPVGLLADITQGTAYRSETIRKIRQCVRKQGYWFHTINPTDFEQDFLFIREVERYSVLIIEVRQPYFAPELLGLAHGRCIPTIRICHLADEEKAQEVAAWMHLTADEDSWKDMENNALPIILSKYQIDDKMEPVIFWRQPDELVQKIGQRLQKITERRVDLISEQEARKYFLSIGRLPGKVFISNANAKNDFVYGLKEKLQHQAVNWFHYKDKDAIAVGSDDWLAEIILEIRNSVVFVALVDNDYQSSEWCMAELDEAYKLFSLGQVEVHVYVLDPSISLPQQLSKMQVEFIENLEEPEQIRRIVENTVAFLETGKQVRLRPRDENRVLKLLAKLPFFNSPNERKMLLKDAALPDRLVSLAPIEATNNMVAVTEIVNYLAKQESELGPHVKALGLLLSHIMGFVNSVEEQEFLAGIIRGYRLMPDIRLQLETKSPLCELGLAYTHDRKEVGTFNGIEGSHPINLNWTFGELSVDMYTSVTNLTVKQKDWQKLLQEIGRNISSQQALADFMHKYEELWVEQSVPNDHVGFCFATDVSGLRIPFEWAIFDDRRYPVCLSHPIRRFLLGQGQPRPTLYKLLTGDLAVPLRVLLVASNTGDIWEVEEEINELFKMFKSLFKQVGWPESNICRLDSKTATPERIKAEILSGHYHLFHFAGHSGHDRKGKPILQVYKNGDMKNVSNISAPMLRRWLSDSNIRFVYLSSCRSASSSESELSSTIRYFESLGQAVIEAGVPELISFIWPIEDKHSKVLASRFYNKYLRSFDSMRALYEARRTFDEENRIWAAPILIKQEDSGIAGIKYK